MTLEDDEVPLLSDGEVGASWGRLKPLEGLMGGYDEWSGLCDDMLSLQDTIQKSIIRGLAGKIGVPSIDDGVASVVKAVEATGAPFGAVVKVIKSDIDIATRMVSVTVEMPWWFADQLGLIEEKELNAKR